MSKNKAVEAPNNPLETTSPVIPSPTLKPEESLPISQPKPSQTLTHLRPPVRASVRKAREALKERAMEILDEFQQTIRDARVAGKYEEALSAYKWLIDHIPADEGKRIIEGSSDKVKETETGNKGPVINIGLRIGGIDSPKQLPEIIDVSPE